MPHDMPHDMPHEQAVKLCDPSTMSVSEDGRIVNLLEWLFGVGVVWYGVLIVGAMTWSDSHEGCWVASLSQSLSTIRQSQSPKLALELLGLTRPKFSCRLGDQLGREQNVLQAEAGGGGEERKEGLRGEALLLPPPLPQPLENPREPKTLPSLYVATPYPHPCLSKTTSPSPSPPQTTDLPKQHAERIETIIRHESGGSPSPPRFHSFYPLPPSLPHSTFILPPPLLLLLSSSPPPLPPPSRPSLPPFSSLPPPPPPTPPTRPPKPTPPSLRPPTACWLGLQPLGSPTTT